jgi:hypothetical protein
LCAEHARQLGGEVLAKRKGVAVRQDLIRKRRAKPRPEGQTQYWRVDENRARGTVKGDTLSFTGFASIDMKVDMDLSIFGTEGPTPVTHKTGYIP